ncbi:MAG: PAS domain-containing sensor histidine kinase [Calditrichaeota bacterium]|nr:MAG: PAS domain-containing sensor histidine kinase [Calditrichota bacterium]
MNLKTEQSRWERQFQLFYNAFLHSTDAILFTDLDGVIIDVNPAFTKIFGWSREEAIGKNTNILRSSKTSNEFYRQMWESIIKKGSWQGEIINRTKQGKEIPVFLSITPIYLEGEKIGYMGIEIDITEKKKIERQLLQEKRFTESIIETANSLIVGLNQKGEIIIFNKKCEEVTGYKKEEILGKNWFEIFLPERCRPDVNEVFEKITAGELKSYYENPILTKSGEERLIAWSNTPIWDEQQNIIGALGIGQDITEQKKLEQQVFQAERFAIIGKMAAKVAHEIRNPLSSISLNAELLEDELISFKNCDTEEARSLLKSIMAEVDRVAALTEDYLQFSRLPESHPVKGDLEDLITNQVKIMSPEFKQKNIRVEMQFKKRLTSVKFDKVQMRRVFLNLFKNAIDAMPRGGDLKITTDVLNNHAIITVEDTGTGITPSEVKKIFQPFYTTKEFGTGLGLAIIQQIIHEHKGKIHCESQEGKGTKFVLELPMD